MKVLFVCNAGICRSRTGSELWKKKFPKDSVKYAGIINIFEPNIFFWPDKIICFEKRIKKLILEMVSNDKEIKEKTTVWEIPDIYDYPDEELVEIIKGKMKNYLAKK